MILNIINHDNKSKVFIDIVVFLYIFELYSYLTITVTIINQNR